jgi:hypothetical protein
MQLSTVQLLYMASANRKQLVVALRVLLSSGLMLLFHALRCIRSRPSLFIRDSWLFATLPSTRRWVEEVAGLADARKIKELLRGFFRRRAVRVVGVVALLAVVVVLLFLILNWYVAPTKPSERKDLVLAVAQILGGTALLSGLYFTWRTLQVNREGQITDRFTRAIDQLGKVEDGKNCSRSG